MGLGKMSSEARAGLEHREAALETHVMGAVPKLASRGRKALERGEAHRASVTLLLEAQCDTVMPFELEKLGGSLGPREGIVAEDQDIEGIRRTKTCLGVAEATVPRHDGGVGAGTSGRWLSGGLSGPAVFHRGRLKHIYGYR